MSVTLPPRSPAPVGSKKSRCASRARVQLFHGPSRSFELHEQVLPKHVGEGEVLVEISLATICGSDLHTIDGRRSAPTPCVLGHEAVGVVVESGRQGIVPGTRVTWSLADSCGHCPACASWHLPQKCDHLFKYGHAALNNGSGLNGCYATHIMLRPGTAVLEVPDTLPDAVVAPANCALATVVSALTDLPSHCDSAWVQGGGLLGLYACAWLRHRGVQQVYCSDIQPQRLDLVADFGGLPVLGDDANWSRSRERMHVECPGGVDLVVEVTGSASVVPPGVQMLRPGGMYVWAGMVHPETVLQLTGEAVIRKCLTIRGMHNYSPLHLAKGLSFLESTLHKLPYEKLVSPALPLASLEEAVSLTRSRVWQRVAVKP
ncbi:zinc-binding dehydrogenase [Verrucomicrobium spinosum]|uniref:zinc-binding dehydrogenase n=1 Tax=Verrucomicrobium spinosum TaxID=2736 RepID=UPI0005C4B439|nr:zinc-binding dehydrogenase [Verrucomicrobium spinosum]